MRFLSSILLLSIFTLSCQSQNSNEERVVGGPCEGCEALLEYGETQLTEVDTLPEFKTTEPKLKIEGKVYKDDGKTPASDIIIYIYHTNRAGIYPTTGDEKGWAKRHGYIQGWVKTDKSGKYEIYTFRPGAYPNRNTPEHIHLTVKEPDTNPYYIDDIMFEDDPKLTENFIKERPNRAGSGIVQPIMENGMLVVRRNIYLGRNIPDYNQF